MADVHAQNDPEATLIPAFHIPLSEEELKTIGELCAIQGQIEFIMQLTVMALCRKSFKRVRKEMSCSNIAANATVWLNAIEKHHPIEELKDLARAIVEEIAVLRRGRNDFVHAVFAFSDEEGRGFWMYRNIKDKPPPRGGNYPAVAVRSLETKPMANLRETRDRLCFLSHFVVAIYESNGVPRKQVPPPKGYEWLSASA